MGDSPAHTVLIFNCEGEAWFIAIFAIRSSTAVDGLKVNLKSKIAKIGFSGRTSLSKANG